MGRRLGHGVVAAIVVVVRAHMDPPTVTAVLSMDFKASSQGPHILGRSVLDLGRSSLGTEAFYVYAQQDP